MRIIKKNLLLKYKNIDIVECIFTDNQLVTHSNLMVEKQDYCQIFAVDKFDNVIFVKQFKVGAGELHELPAGHIKNGESAEECVKRELREETGYIVNDVKFLFEAYASPGVLSNRIFAFWADSAEKRAETEWDSDEEIETILIPKEELLQKITQEGFKTDLGTHTLIYRVLMNVP